MVIVMIMYELKLKPSAWFCEFNAHLNVDEKEFNYLFDHGRNGDHDSILSGRGVNFTGKLS